MKNRVTKSKRKRFKKIKEEDEAPDSLRVTGIVSSIQRLAIHDGPGIRTIVFLKGCSLKCPWCSSPETQSFEEEILFYRERCLGCNKCLEVCPEKAILLSPGGQRVLVRSRCTVCGECTEVCHGQALRIVGERKSVEQVLQEVGRDRSFYQNSGGGVTISGGEPLQQASFTRALLHACRAAGFHTAMETSGYKSWRLMKETLSHLDLLLIDLKQMDPKKHKELTGVSNKVILNNLKKAVGAGVQTVIRIPVIPGCNDDVQNIMAMCRFLKQIDQIKRIDLLPYHRFGEATYGRLGRSYSLEDLEPKTEKDLEPIADTFSHEGFEVQIGG